MRIGILGGSFNPIHIGHIQMAKQAIEKLSLDEVWVMPAGAPPHKSDDEMASRFHRFRMSEIACEDIPNCKVVYEEYESISSKNNFTYLTMEKLSRKYPEHEFYFIMGQDSIDYFDKWKEPQRILDVCKVVVFLRKNSDDVALYDKCLNKIETLKQSFYGEFLPVDYEPVGISSTEIRTMISERISDDEILKYLPRTELEYIHNHRLYEMKEEYNLKEISDSLKNVLKTSRFEHTLGVAYTAASLAMNYGYDTNKARVAGLLHDCAKYLSNDELVDYCKEHNLEITDGEIKAPHLLHAKAGAHMAKELYHIEDDEVLHAILVHTTGCPDMSLLDEIIFVADYIEPNRNKAHRLEEIRQMAFQNIKLAIAMILEDTISYIDAKEQFLDSSTIDTYDYYKKEISK